MDAAARALAVPELVRMVVQHLPRSKHILAACLVNRFWKEIATPILYRAIDLRTLGNSFPGPDINDAIFEFIMPRGSDIQSLHVDGLCDPALVTALLAETSQLRRLSMNACVGVSRASAIEGRSIHPALSSELPRTLRHLTLEFDGAVCDSADLARLSGSPPLRLSHLSLHGLYDWPEALAFISRHGSNVVTLGLTGTGFWYLPETMWRQLAGYLPRVIAIQMRATIVPETFFPQDLPPTIQDLTFGPSNLASIYRLWQCLANPTYLQGLRKLRLLDLDSRKMRARWGDPQFAETPEELMATMEDTITSVEGRKRGIVSAAEIERWRAAAQAYEFGVPGEGPHEHFNVFDDILASLAAAQTNAAH